MKHTYLVAILIILAGTCTGAYVLLSGRTARGETKAAATKSASPKPSHTPKVGIQVGHMNNEDLPDELSNLRTSSTGTSAGGYDEWEVGLKIAEAVADGLRKSGIEVDILPATVPENYTADAFVAVHSDGNDDTTVSGYKVAASSWDTTGKAEELCSEIEDAYGQETGMGQDVNITEDMTDYYAFNYNRFTHTVSTKTPAVIVETGFLTNRSDRDIIAGSPELPAQGVADGIRNFLNSYSTLD